MQFWQTQKTQDWHGALIMGAVIMPLDWSGGKAIRQEELEELRTIPTQQKYEWEENHLKGSGGKAIRQEELEELRTIPTQQKYEWEENHPKGSGGKAIR